MLLEYLKSYHFRNLVDAPVQFSPGVNVIIGKNGQGKTSLLEAIHVLSLTKSFRTSLSKELIAWGEKEGSVHAKVVSSAGEYEIGVSFQERSRTLYLNHQKVKTLSEYLGKLICVSFSPADLSLLQGSPSERRRFLDKHMVDITPTLIENILTYNRALQNKNKILKDGIRDVSLLDPWNEILVREALVIKREREKFLIRLEERAGAIYRKFSSPDGDLTLKLSSNYGTQGDSVEAVLEEYKAIRSREAAYGNSIIGPQRDDVEISFGGREARAFASQGQARSMVLSLTLGVIELIEEKFGESPLVLLDDVNSELDLGRSEAFFDLVLSQQRQIFITGTDASVGHLASTQEHATHFVEGGWVAVMTGITKSSSVSLPQ